MSQGLFRDHRIRGRKLQEIRRRHLMEHPLCEHCKRRGIVREARHVDHIVALVNGGRERPENRQSLCIDCHADKTAQDLGYRIKPGGDLNGDSLDPNDPWYAKAG